MTTYSLNHLSSYSTLICSLSHEAKHHAFITHWKQSNCPSPLASVSYVNGTTSSQHEAFEEALHISKCFQLPVFGIYHSKTPYQEAQALFEFYNHTFSSQPNARIFQVFFGDGGDVVQAAIELLHSSLQQRIIVIGMNPTKLLKHPQSRYFQTCAWPFLHSKKHDITHLHLHPDSNPRHLRSNDPAFSPALQSISLPSAHLKYYPQKSQRWSHARIHHATNLALTGLCLSAHASIKIKSILRSEASRTSMTTSSRHQHHFTNLMPLPSAVSMHTLDTSFTVLHSLPQLLLPGGTFPNGTIPGGNYPYDIFPGRISPKGEFDNHIYLRIANHKAPSRHHFPNDQRYPFGEFKDGSFPYLQFFSGITSDCMNKHGKLRNSLLQRKREILPFGIHSSGDFLELLDVNPYGFFHVSGTFTSSKTCKNGFPYYRFFSGELIPERYSNGTLSPNDPLYHHLPNGKLPEVYPGYILPNGSFPNPHMEYPFGFFENNSFPYADFFFGNFDYVGRYLEQLNKTNPLLSPFKTTATSVSTSLIEYCNTFSTPFLYKTTTTSHSISIDNFSASLASNPLTTPIQEYYDGNQDLLTTVWIIQGSALALLVTTHGSNKIKKARRVALAISSFTTYLAALDLSKQIHSAICAHKDLFSFSTQGSLILYNAAYLAQEIINFPWLRNQSELFIAKANPGDNYTLSEGIRIISNIFHHNITIIRSCASIFKIHFIALFYLLFFIPTEVEDTPQLWLYICYLLFISIVAPHAITSFREKND